MRIELELRELAAHNRRCGNAAGLVFAQHAERHLQSGREFPNGWSLPQLGPPDRCFGNAQALARERGWRYVEGLAVEPAGPGYAAGWIEHAWCLDDQGRVAEPTWAYWAPRRYFGTVTPLPVTGVPGENAAYRDANPAEAAAAVREASRWLMG